MSISEEIKLLSDEDALKVLSRALSGTGDDNLFKYAVTAEAWSQVVDGFGKELKPKEDKDLGDNATRAKASRLVLQEWASDPLLSRRVASAIREDRTVLVEPVTTALVLAGIIFVLQTKFDLKINKQNGRTHIDFSAEKKATSEGLLKKFFDFFKA